MTERDKQSRPFERPRSPLGGGLAVAGDGSRTSLTITVDKHNEILDREREIAHGWREEADLLALELRRIAPDNIALGAYAAFQAAMDQR